VCGPLLGVFRSAIPSVMGVDLSPIFALFVLQTFTDASQALSAELPPSRTTAQVPRSSLVVREKFSFRRHLLK